MTNLELRKAALEACNIRTEYYEPMWRIVGLTSHEQRRYSFEKTAIDDMPSIESDATTAIRMLREKCVANGWTYELRFGYWDKAKGETYSECIISAEYDLNTYHVSRGLSREDPLADCARSIALALVEAGRKL